jgi:hypothetical protein
MKVQVFRLLKINLLKLKPSAIIGSCFSFIQHFTVKFTHSTAYLVITY